MQYVFFNVKHGTILSVIDLPGESAADRYHRHRYSYSPEIDFLDVRDFIQGETPDKNIRLLKEFCDKK